MEFCLDWRVLILSQHRKAFFYTWANRDVGCSYSALVAHDEKSDRQDCQPHIWAVHRPACRWKSEDRRAPHNSRNAPNGPLLADIYSAPLSPCWNFRIDWGADKWWSHITKGSRACYLAGYQGHHVARDATNRRTVAAVRALFSHRTKQGLIINSKRGTEIRETGKTNDVGATSQAKFRSSWSKSSNRSCLVLVGWSSWAWRRQSLA